MAIKLTKNEKYGNYSLDMKALEPTGADWIEFSLKFDEPKKGVSEKFGNEWNLFSVTLHKSSNGDEGDKDVSFFSKGESPKDFMKLGDYLQTFGAGDRFRLTHTLKNFGKMWGSKWTGGPLDASGQIIDVGSIDSPVDSSEPKTVEQPAATPVNHGEIAQKLFDASEGTQQPPGWLGGKLREMGYTISNESDTMAIVTAYNAKW